MTDTYLSPAELRELTGCAHRERQAKWLLNPRDNPAKSDRYASLQRTISQSSATILRGFAGDFGRNSALGFMPPGRRPNPSRDRSCGHAR